MLVKKVDDIEKTKVEMEGVSGASVQWLVGRDTEAPNFYLRLFELEPGGHTPLHTHPWEHEVLVLEGTGKLNTGETFHPLEKNSVALVMPGDKHQFENTGSGPFKFLCIIPTNGK